MSHVARWASRQFSEVERPLRTAITVQKSGECPGEPGVAFYDVAISANKIPEEWDALHRLKWAGDEMTVAHRRRELS